MSDDPTFDYSQSLPLPDGAIPQQSVLVVGFFTPDGETRYGLHTSGDSSLGTVVGLLELAKAHLLAEHFSGSG